MPPPAPLSASVAQTRLVTTWPPPRLLADYAPFRPLDGYAVRQLGGMAAPGLASLRSVCQQGFAARETVGLSCASKIEAVFFDMDATVIREESLVELAAYAGVGPQVAEITEQAMRGELDFSSAVMARVALLRGLPVTAINDLAGRLTLMPGICEFVAFCRELGVATFMVSGGFVQLAAGIARQVGFHGYFASSLESDGKELTGRVDGPIVDAQAKLDFVTDTCAKNAWPLASVAAVGDGANDLLMLQAVGVAVGHHAKEVLFPTLCALNETGDHRFLAPLLFGRSCAGTRTAP